MSCRLLVITELGGYPDYVPDYRRLGFEVTAVTSMRKAVASIRRQPPEVIIAEFNFQSDFRDRSSSLETLMASLQGLDAEPLLIVFFEQEYQAQFDALRRRFPIHAAFAFPIDRQALLACLAGIKSSDCTAGG